MASSIAGAAASFAGHHDHVQGISYVVKPSTTPPTHPGSGSVEVFDQCDWFQVFWVNAQLHSAQVINGQVGEDRPTQHRIEVSVGQYGAFEFFGQPTIPAGKYGSLPYPAPCPAVDAVVLQWRGRMGEDCRPCTSPALIMLATHAPTEVSFAPVVAISSDRALLHLLNDTRGGR